MTQRHSTKVKLFLLYCESGEELNSKVQETAIESNKLEADLCLIIFLSFVYVRFSNGAVKTSESVNGGFNNRETLIRKRMDTKSTYTLELIAFVRNPSHSHPRMRLWFPFMEQLNAT